MAEHMQDVFRERQQVNEVRAVGPDGESTPAKCAKLQQNLKVLAWADSASA